MNPMTPIRCPDCRDTAHPVSDGAYLCRGCGMLWSPGEFQHQYSVEEFDLDYGDEEGDRGALEDLDAGSDDFIPCPCCGGRRVASLSDLGGELRNKYFCRNCGAEFSLADGSDDAEKSVSRNTMTCPHCRSLDSIATFGDIEWCSVCWMDPNDPDQSSPDIAKLYKGGVERVLLKDPKMLNPHRPMGAFLRKECGPHCTLAEICPQTTTIFIQCFKEDTLFRAGKESEAVGKKKRGGKRRGKNKNLQNHIYKHNRQRHINKRPKVAFYCSKGGLLEKMVLYGTTNPDTEQPGNTGGQSGA